MVAIRRDSEYLKILGNTLSRQGCDTIVIMFSRFGKPGQLPLSQMRFLREDGSVLNPKFLRHALGKSTSLKNADILEIFITSNLMTSSADIMAAKFTIHPKTWLIGKTEATYSRNKHRA